MTAAASLVDLAFCALFATRMVRVRKGASGPVAAALAWSVLFSSVFFGGFLFLGLLGLLTGRSVVNAPLAAAISAAAAAASWWMKRRAPVPASGLRYEAGQALHRAVSDLDGASRTLLAAVAVTFVCAGAMLSAGFPRGFESAAYHLPIAVHIDQTGSLRVWDREYMEAFPANASLYYGFLLNFLPERMVSASDLLFLPLLLLALYGLGRWTGADRSACVIAACGAATIPIVAFSCLETGADVAGMAFLGAAIYFALAGDVFSDSDLLLAGLSAGLAFGFKSLHIVSIGFLFGVVVLRRWREARGTSTILGSSDVAARGAGLFLAGVLVMSGTWLVRNWMEFHNPVYPVHIGAVFDVLGWAEAPDVNYLDRRPLQFEWVRSVSEWFVYPWVEWHSRDENFKHSSGLGAFFAALVPPALLVGSLALFRRSERGRGRIAWLLAGGGLVFGVWWILGDRQPRYLMGGLVYGLPLVAWMIARSSAGARRAFGWIAGITGVFMFGVVLSTEAVRFFSTFVRHRHWARDEFYSYPAEVDRLPAGATIANLVARPENFGLFGSNHSNHVINAQRAFRILSIRPGEIPESVVLDVRALRRLGADYLFVAGKTKLEPGPGVHVAEVGRFNNDTRDEDKVLYFVHYPSGDFDPADPARR